MNRLPLSVLCVLIAAGSAFAIDDGPGGRLYMLKSGQDLNGTNTVQLRSLVIEKDWSISSSVDHGWIRDVGFPNYHNNYVSPEVSTYGGKGYGKLVIGLNYNNTPPSSNGTYEVMDALEITPSDAGYTVSLLGDGRGALGTVANGWQDWVERHPSTEGATAILPDPGGTFAGAGNYVLEWRHYEGMQMILTDSFGDGDITDDVEDYAVNTNSMSSLLESDIEVSNGKLFISTGWGAGTDDMVYQNSPGGGRINFVDEDNTGLDIHAAPGIAATAMDGHTALYVGGTSNAEARIFLCIDENDDGDALEPGEVKIAYSASDISGSFSADDPSQVYDIELITARSGKVFLLFCRGSTWPLGETYTVIGLDANGLYDGNGYTTISEEDGTYDFNGSRQIEFDSQDMLAKPKFVISVD